MFNYYPILLEADKKQPKWQGEQFTKGIYQLVVPMEKIKDSIFSKNASYIIGNVNCQYWRFNINLTSAISVWIKAVAINNITFDEPMVHIIGRFQKQGTQIYFVPETEKHYDAQPY